jgi:hypothetical protein
VWVSLTLTMLPMKSLNNVRNPNFTAIIQVPSIPRGNSSAVFNEKCFSILPVHRFLDPCYSMNYLERWIQAKT